MVNIIPNKSWINIAVNVALIVCPHKKLRLEMISVGHGYEIGMHEKASSENTYSKHITHLVFVTERKRMLWRKKFLDDEENIAALS